MKYLKKFESINKYKEGDYILINTMDKYEPYCKIKTVMNDYDPEVDIWWEWFSARGYNKEIQYTAEIFNKDKKVFEEDFINDSIIIRKMTKSEIKIFDQLKILTKYNL